MIDREAMKLALEALEFAASQIYNEDNDDIIADAITALRQALEQPEQEPVGEIVNAFGDLTSVSIPEMPPVGTKLYTAPAKQTKTNQCGEVCERAKLCYACGYAIQTDEHQELADDEIYDAAFNAYSRPGFDRDAFRYWWTDDKPLSIDWNKDELVRFAKNIAALYTSPPKREWQWLTDEEIMVCGGMDGADTWAFEFAYAIETKLKEKNRG